MLRNKKGFTLIELLVAIAIIGLIVSIVSVNLRGTRGKARIARGLQFSQNINHVLGIYAVGVWSFDRYGDPISDLSGYGNHCSFNGNPQEEPKGIIRRALHFDGSTDYLNCGNNTSLNITDEITIEAWVKFDVLSNIRPIVSKDDGFSDSDVAYSLIWDADEGGTMNFYIYNGGSQDNAGTKNDFVTERWYHIAVTAVDGGNVVHYVDGTLDKSSALVGNLSINTFPLMIGRQWTDYFDGIIDEVRIYDVTLTTGEIQKHYVEGLERHRGLALGE